MEDRKKWKENQATKVTKRTKNKRQKYGMNETRVNWSAPPPPLVPEALAVLARGD